MQVQYGNFTLVFFSSFGFTTGRKNIQVQWRKEKKKKAFNLAVMLGVEEIMASDMQQGMDHAGTDSGCSVLAAGLLTIRRLTCR